VGQGNITRDNRLVESSELIAFHDRSSVDQQQFQRWRCTKDECCDRISNVYMGKGVHPSQRDIGELAWF
jgi:hypothetical protein